MTSLPGPALDGTHAIRHPLAGVFIALASGIAADHLFDVPLPIWCGALGLACLGWSLLFWLGRVRASGFVLWLALLAMGGSWHHFQWNYFRYDNIVFCAAPNGSPVRLQAVALEVPRLIPAARFDPLSPFPRGEQTRMNVAVTGIAAGTSWKPASGKTRLFIGGTLTGVRPGDRLTVNGSLQGSSQPSNPGEFSFYDHRRGQRSMARVSVPLVECVTVGQSSSRWNPRWWLPRFRGQLAANLRRFVGSENLGLATALLLGQRDLLERSQVNAFFVTGTIHLLAISGLHVGILASIFVWAARCRVLPDRTMIWTVILLAITYALITVARAPILRAAVLLEIFCLGWLIRRQAAPLNSLAAAGTLVLCINPSQLFNAGAQLSFLAVASLVWSAPWLRRDKSLDPLQRLIVNSRSHWQQKLSAWGRGIKEMLVLSLIIWTVTLPLVMYRFNIVSPWAIVLNLVLWVPLCLALLSGFLTMLLGPLVPALGELGGRFCEYNLNLLQTCVVAAADLPASHFWVAGLGTVAVIVFYFTLALVASYKPARPYWWVWLPLTFSGLALSVWGHQQLSNEVTGETTARFTFLSVGHGTCVVCEFPNRRTFLYDAGCLGSPQRCANSVSRFLWARGIRKLDKVVLSHADADHYNALPALARRFSIAEVCVSPVMFENPDWGVEQLHEACVAAKITLREIQVGDILFQTDRSVVRVLHPSREGVPGSDNANSIVLRIDSDDVRLLLPGDIEGAGLESLLSQQPLDCDLVLAPHHGSLGSRPREFVKWCTPEWVVISGGSHRNIDKVCGVYQENGLRVLHTARHGAVSVSVDARGMSVESWWAEPARPTNFQHSAQPNPQTDKNSGFAHVP